ncbi:MAG: beta-N-acetylhexosaminidase [Bryobacteraceae bacterium]
MIRPPLFVLTASLVCAQAVPTNTLPLMPMPASVNAGTGSRVVIDANFSVSFSGAGASDPRLRDLGARTTARVSRQTGIPILPRVVPAPNATLNIVVEGKDHRGPQRLGDIERYSLQTGDNKIRISADAPLGALRGVETFLQLVAPNPPGSVGWSVPPVTIRDEPRFPWRGLSLDVSRHFIPLEGVKRTLDGLAAVKLNVFHWHLSDDQGFRIESKKYPRLQQLGSDGQFYTQAEVRDVIAYARDRGIRVVPEFDIPGHATSWLPGYPALASGKGPYEIMRSHGVLTALIDPTKESTYKFMDGFVGEMAKLFPDEYFHIGGDEVNPREWRTNAKIQSFMKKRHIPDEKALQVYFNQRLLKIVTKHGKHMEGWDEVLQPNLPKTIVIQSWRGQESLWQAAREGFPGILSAGYYLDLMQSASQHYAIDPLVLPPARKERLQKENKPIPPDLTAAEAKNILGGEAAMWEELATAENLDAKLWPRLAAIAERFWSPQSTTDIPSMYSRLALTNGWLQWLGLTQVSNLELMRERIAGSVPRQTLDKFAAILEPVKGYSRHAQNYSSSTPLNKLVDSIPPESDAAREFNNAVDRYLSGANAAPESLMKQMREWRDNAEQILPMLRQNSLLEENIPVGEAVVTLCEIGQDAIASRAPNSTVALKADIADRVARAAERKGDILIQIAPGIQKLVDAAGPKPGAN